MKAAYECDDLFRINQNILPVRAGRLAVSPATLHLAEDAEPSEVRIQSLLAGTRLGRRHYRKSGYEDGRTAAAIGSSRLVASANRR